MELIYLFCIGINPLHAAVIVVGVQPGLYRIILVSVFGSFIVTHQCHTGHHNIAAHKNNQYPGHDCSGFLRNFLNPFGDKGINSPEPDYRGDSPEETIQQIDSSPNIKGNLAIVPEHFTKDNLGKDTAEVFVYTTQQGSDGEEEKAVAVPVFIKK